MKKCPYCAEDIQDAAVVCRHCGRDLKGGASQVQIVQPKKGVGCWTIGCLGVIAICVVFFVIGLIGTAVMPHQTPPLSTSAAAPTPPPSTVRLLADAKVSDTQIEIDNIGPTDWTDVRIEINGGLLSSGYVHRVKTLGHTKSYTVGLMQFTDRDGNRFNPFQKKVQQISITAKTDGKDGVRVFEGR